MSKLFKNEDSDSDEKLNINTEYAKNYDSWRQKEELHKLKARYGEDVESLPVSGSDSESSSDDDQGEEIPEDFEKSFYKTLACLKNKDPRIYNENVKFFKEVDKNEENGIQKKKEKKEKSLFLRDYERQIIVEKGGKLSDSEDEDEVKQREQRNPTYVQEQQELKESFKKVIEDEDNEEDDLLKPKTKSQGEKEKEDKDYKEWLKGQKEDIDEEEQKDLKPLRDFWTDPNLDKNEKFLRDYILNKKFLDKDSNEIDLDYDHVIHDSDDNLSEDERNINKQEEFEHKYNFRFEEPDQEFIKRYPRTLENSLRKKDTRRAEKRAERKAHKEQEKLKQREELKQLKALKRKEIEEKIEKLKEITGNDDLQLDMSDLEGDFNPEEYDKKMSKIFNEDYYAQETDEMKPEFPEIDEELCIESTWDNYDPNSEEIIPEEIPYHDGLHCDDPNFNMDADYDGQKSLKNESEEPTKKRKRRRRNKFAEMIAKEKPKFDPAQHTSVQEYYDQYYALDYEDMIGDIPCRFKYRNVVPNDYGLTIDEILRADDKELNRWCSLKKALQYKPDHREMNDVKMYKQKAANEALKRKILPSLYKPVEEEDDQKTVETGTSESQEQQSGKRKRKRKKKSQNNEETVQNKDDNKIDVETKEVVKNEENIEKPTEKKELTKEKIEVEKPTENNVKNDPSAKEKTKNKKKRKFDEIIESKIEPVTIEKKKKKKNIPKNEAESKECTEFSVNGEQIATKNNEKLNANLFKKKKSKKANTSTSEENNKTINGKIQKKNKLKNKNKNNTSKENNTLSKKEKRKQLFKKIKNKKEKTEKNKDVDPVVSSLSTERLKAYGLNPKKFKNKLKYGNKK